jgi:hypothetical protein
LFDAIVDPNQLVADWIMSLYDVQEGLTAAYYRPLQVLQVPRHRRRDRVPAPVALVSRSRFRAL